MAQNLVTSLFQPMSQGHLRMVHPDGSVREFGSVGQTPGAEIHVRQWRFFTRCAIGGDIGFGEAYQDGDWETPDLAAVRALACHSQDAILAAAMVAPDLRPVSVLGVLSSQHALDLAS